MLMRILLCASLSFFAASQCYAWGQIGHRVTGEIAEQFLSEQAKREIRKLFPNSSLAEISTFADEMRSNPSEFWQRTANPWHYVTVPKGKTYQQVGAPKQGDAVTALKMFTEVLQSKTASIDAKKRALHFIVHIIGDLHQPLHVGNGTDKGGNDVKVFFFWEDSNLHRVWDSGMIDQKKLSYTEWADWLGRKITPKMAQKWDSIDPNVWIAESVALREGVYPKHMTITWQYSYKHIPTVKKRLQQAGVRIAAYLNNVFAE